MLGYDIDLVKSISKQVTIPTIALGGCRDMEDCKTVFRHGGANGIAAGSFFVYQGSNKGVLINYPSREDIIKIL